MNWLGALVAVVYLPGIRQVATAPRWAILAIGVPICLLLLRRLVMPMGLLWLLLYAAISLVWAELPMDGLNGFFQLALSAGAFVLGASASVGVVERTAKWWAWGIGLSCLLAIAQVAGWRPILEVQTPSGLFGNKNMLAEAALLALVVAVAFRQHLLSALCLVGVGVTWSRGVWIAGAVALGIWLLQKNKKLGLALVTLACLVLPASLATPQVRDYMHSGQRVQIWLDSWDGMDLWGRGIGQFYGLYPEFAKRQDTMEMRPNHAHNDGIELAFELGLPGLALCAWLFAGFFGPMDWRSFLCLALGIEALFSFPLHNPATAFIGPLVAGGLWSSRAELRRAKYAGESDRSRGSQIAGCTAEADICSPNLAA